MANISDKTNMSNHTGVVNESGVAGANWISQINAGGTVYDIATHHGITFREGSGGATTTWNGLSDIEVVIPSITDIVQTPIEFVGVVGANGEIDWQNGHSAPAKAGNLVFIASDCTFNSIACEAGDMAIYDGTKWNIVSGENQVKITGTTNGDIKDGNRTVVAVGSVKDVLEVEGKALALTLDYVDLNTNHLTVTKDLGDAYIAVDFGDMTVDSTYIKLTYAGDKDAMDISKDVDLDIPTQLTDGTVTLTNADSLIKDVNFGTFNAGTLPSFSKNESTTWSVSGGTLSKIDAGDDFVSSVSIDDITFVDGADGDGKSIKMLTDLVAGNNGGTFFTDIHSTSEDETANLTIEGYITPEGGVNTKYVTGLKEGSPLKGITGGGITLDNTGSDFATGFGAAVPGDGGEVLSKVTLAANNETSVLNAASVTDHVLSFGSTKVTSDAKLSYESKSLTKGKYKYTAPTGVAGEFTTGGFEKVANKDYTFGTAMETTYSSTPVFKKLNTPALTVETASYQINDDNMKTTVPANAFVSTASTGTLPSLTGQKATPVKVTGTVNTALTTETKSLNVLADGLTSITLPGAYRLESGAKGDGVSLEVGKAGELADFNASVNLKGYVTDVKIQ